MLKLQEIRKIRKISQQKLADKIGVSRSTIAMWETQGSQPDNDALIKLSDVFNVSVDYLLGRIDNNVEPISLDRSTVKIPVLGRIPAGVPFEAIEDIIEYIEIPESMTEGDKEFFALKIKGDSMLPKYNSGDIVIFEKSDDCESGSDCAIMINGDDATFKKIDKTKDGIVVRPLNPDYDTMYFTDEQIINTPVRILGVAREIRREV